MSEIIGPLDIVDRTALKQNEYVRTADRLRGVITTIEKSLEDHRRDLKQVEAKQGELIRAVAQRMGKNIAGKKVTLRDNADGSCMVVIE